MEKERISSFIYIPQKEKGEGRCKFVRFEHANETVVEDIQPEETGLEENKIENISLCSDLLYPFKCNVKVLFFFVCYYVMFAIMFIVTIWAACPMHNSNVTLIGNQSSN